MALRRRRWGVVAALLGRVDDCAAEVACAAWPIRGGDCVACASWHGGMAGACAAWPMRGMAGNLARPLAS